MAYEIAIPEPIQDKIASWGLPVEVEDRFYAELEGGFTQEELDRLWKHPGPGFAYVYNLDFQDPLNCWTTYFFTLWLVRGSLANQLYIYQCNYEAKEGWSLEGQYDGYEPDYGENE